MKLKELLTEAYTSRELLKLFRANDELTFKVIKGEFKDQIITLTDEDSIFSNYIEIPGKSFDFNEIKVLKK